MKKFILAAAVLTALSCQVFCAEINDISAIEKDLFGVEYKEEQTPTRLSRIEEYLFGEKKSGTNSERIKKITDASGLSTEPKKTENEKRIAAAEFLPEDKNVTYPVIDMMEEKVFNKTYQGENVYKRVERLEQKTFGKVSQGELSDRTDKLKASVLAINANESMLANNSEPQPTTPEEFYRQSPQNYYTPQERNFSFGGTTMGGFKTGSSNNPYTYGNSKNNTYSSYPTGGAASYHSDFEQALSSAENMILGRTNPNATEDERLSKMEKKVFKKTFSGDSLSRLDRVVSAAHAQKTGVGYHENKFDRYLSGGLQAGMILLMILAMIL